MFFVFWIYVDVWLVDFIGKERVVEGSVEFDLRMIFLVIFWYGVYWWRRYVMVYCYDVVVGVFVNSSLGKMVGFVKRCKFF